MAHWNPPHPLDRAPYGAVPFTPALTPRIIVLALTLAGAVPGFAILYLTPTQLWLPALSAASLAASAGIALVAWLIRARRQGSELTAWDIAGAYAALGFVAAMFTKPGDVLQFIGLA